MLFREIIGTDSESHETHKYTMVKCWD